jgi:colanic acid/amylovoran biosynthesis protein
MFFKKYIRSIRMSVDALFRVVDAYFMSVREPESVGADRKPHLLILPSHPENPFGSRGDQAMTFAIIDKFKHYHPGALVSVVSSENVDLNDSCRADLNLMPVWGKHTILETKGLAEVSHLAVIGADVMDGYYWPITVLRALQFSEKARILGVKVAVLGFSFNSKPNQFCKLALGFSNKNIRLFVRDPISAARFEASVSRGYELVADSAFHMSPRATDRVSASLEWVASMRKAGNVILGFNIHAMLFDVKGVCDQAVALQNVVFALNKILDQSGVAMLFMAHDFRGEKNDLIILQKCLAGISEKNKGLVYLSESEFYADELKALAGACDIVATARMHLAIAALGCKVPTAVIDYQDKFEGLFSHFSLPKKYIFDPKNLNDRDAIYSWLADALVQRNLLRDSVVETWDQVMQLSHKNFTWMAGE